MDRKLLVWAAIFGAIAVALGAFGAHGLKSYVPEQSIATFDTGVRYQFYHVFALIAVALLIGKKMNSWLKWSGYLFIIGIFLFSGSLYLLTALKVTGSVGLSGIGIITPFGGLAFIAGWLAMLGGVWKRED